MSDIIVTSGLGKVYPASGRAPEVVAVESLDMSVRAGEIYGLLGPNGAGKSTTIGMLTTRVTPTSGSATVAGVDVIRRGALAKQVIGVVPQTNTLDRAMTVRENLDFHGRYFGMSARSSRALADELLSTVRLSERSDSSVMTLSGGMAQRLMIARAIMHRPQVLFLDEPTAGLDPQSRLALWEILRGLHAEGQTILLTTHYMEEADVLCDRVAIMDHGRLLALDSPAGLKSSVGAGTEIRVTAEGDLTALAAHLERELGTARQVRVVGQSVRISVERASGLLPRIVTSSDAAGFTITDLSVNEPTLETVFIQLTGKDLRE
jgi:ABC-2 type transport system ATP-binding protein